MVHITLCNGDEIDVRIENEINMFLNLEHYFFLGLELRVPTR
jgi:hypothetical protein